jgi:hypothetical protein
MSFRSGSSSKTIRQFEQPSYRVDKDLPKIEMSRYAYVGNMIGGSRSILAYRLSKITEPIPAMRVSDMSHYGFGCNVHDSCFGHYCVTDDDTLLLPQELARQGVDNKNAFNSAASRVFASVSSRQYKYYSELREMVLGKRGLLRGKAIPTPVEGSARMVIVRILGFSIRLCWHT